MTATDMRGHRLSGATPAALAAYEDGLRQLSLYAGDPLAAAEAALAASPELVMAHALKAWLHLLGTEPAGVPVARAALEAAHAASGQRPGAAAICIAIGASGRRALAHGLARAGGPDHRLSARPARAAGRPPDRLLPRRRAHAARPHRARAAGVVARRARLSRRARHAGLRPRGDRRTMRAAERRGRAAVELEPRDGWAQHAVAHVLEMQGRHRDGIAWMRGNSRRTGRARASSPCTTGGTSRSITSISARSTRCSRCSTGRSSARARA